MKTTFSFFIVASLSFVYCLSISNRREMKSEADILVENMKLDSSLIYNQQLDKSLIITVPYFDNEDYLISPIGLGTPINFFPVQVDTTTYKSWVPSSECEEIKSIFSYNPLNSSSSVKTDEWGEVVDEQGTAYGEVIKDNFVIGNYHIKNFSFISATKLYNDFLDYSNGKLGLGFCEYGTEEDKKFCLLEQLKLNNNIDKKLFSFREVSDTHGEIVIGDVTENIKEVNFPMLHVANKNIYDNLKDEEFKMAWITNVTHILFKTEENENSTKLFKNGIRTPGGLAAFDTACSYIEAPYDYINEFEEKMFDVYFKNICHKANEDGIVKFLCEQSKYNQNLHNIKNFSLVLVIDGYGFDIPIEHLFEQTSVNHVEFFVQFRKYSQNVWNLGHPFLHNYVIVFDQDNKLIGTVGEGINPMEEIIEEVKESSDSDFWKWLLLVLLLLILVAALFWIGRKIGIKFRKDKGVPDNLIDNESVEDYSFNPGNNIG